jgi:hypothetical protein
MPARDTRTALKRAKFAFGLLTLGGAVFLAISNPTEVDMRNRLGRDGWVPVGFERTNLVLLSWVNVNGLSGAKATYLGVGGTIFQLSGD